MRPAAFPSPIHPRRPGSEMSAHVAKVTLPMKSKTLALRLTLAAVVLLPLAAAAQNLAIVNGKPVPKARAEALLAGNFKGTLGAGGVFKEQVHLRLADQHAAIGRQALALVGIGIGEIEKVADFDWRKIADRQQVLGFEQGWPCGQGCH